MLNLERANATRRVTWWSLVGLVVVPVLVAGGFLWAIWGSGDRLDRVQAAVVNLDEGVEIDGQQVPLGRQLVGGLVDSEEENFTWNLSDEDDAADGLASGRYAAVITIPENFSEAATSYGGEAAEAEQATIDVQTSQVTGIADGALGRAIGQAAAETVSSTLTETYLDNIYVGFNDIADQFGTVAEGAGSLADGSEELSSGLVEVGDGIEQLSTGLDALSTSGGELATGLSELATGTGELAGGGAALATGAGELADGVSQLDEGVPALTSGAGQLADGASEYAEGIEQYTGGVSQAAAGVSQLNDQLQQGLGGVDLSGPSEEEVAQLAGGATALAEGVGGFADGLGQYQQGLAQVAEEGLPAGAEVPCPPELGGDPQACAVFAQAFEAGVQQGAQGALDGLQTPGPDGTTLADGIEALGEGADQFSGGIEELTAGLGQLSGLGEQVQQLLDGVDQLDTGLSTLAESGPALNSGADDLASGASQLSGGLDQLGTGIGQLDEGAAQLSTGVSTYTDGVTAISEGLAPLSLGLTQYTDGVSETATGVATLSEGFGDVEDGASQLAEGNRELADGLAEGAEQIPTYSEQERENLAGVVAEPVTAGEAGTDLLPEAGATSLLMVLALWLGALATFLVVQPVSATTWMSSRPSWQLALLAMVPGAAVATVQAIALTAVGQVVLDLSAGKVVALLGLLLLVGYAFVGINHALAAWLGGPGRLISVTMVVLTAAGSILSAVPALFDALVPLLPLTPALDAVLALVTGGSGTGDAAVGVLLWLLVAVAASVLAVIRHRSVNPAVLLRAAPA